MAGSAQVTESGAMEPRESGKVGLEGPWGHPLPFRRPLIWAPARRGARAESLQMSQPCRGGLARSPAACSSAFGRLPLGGLRRDQRTHPLRAARSSRFPWVSSGRTTPPSVDVGGRGPAQCSDGKGLSVFPQLWRFEETQLVLRLGGWMRRSGSQGVEITERQGDVLDLPRSLPKKVLKRKRRRLAYFQPTSVSSLYLLMECLSIAQNHIP